MSSVKSRLTIESYENGGYGVFIDLDKDLMGLRAEDIEYEVKKWLIIGKGKQ